MIEELTRLLQRQLEAVTEVEMYAGALEAAATANEDQLASAAIEHLEQARDRLAALELARTMALAASGIPTDTSASTLCGSLAAGRCEALARDTVDELRRAVLSAQAATQRAAAAVTVAA